jgi:hypothetical protein
VGVKCIPCNGLESEFKAKIDSRRLEIAPIKSWAKRGSITLKLSRCIPTFALPVKLAVDCSDEKEE